MASTPEVDDLPTEATLGQFKEFLDGMAGAIKAHESNVTNPHQTYGTYVFNQTDPSALWEVAHGLNSYPATTILDSTGQLIDAQVEYVSANLIHVYHTAPETGKLVI